MYGKNPDSDRSNGSSKGESSNRVPDKQSSESGNRDDWDSLNRAQERVIRRIARQELARQKNRERRKRRPGTETGGLFGSEEREQDQKLQDVLQKLKEEKHRLEQIEGELESDPEPRKEVSKDENPGAGRFSHYLENRSKGEAFLLGVVTGMALLFLINIILRPPIIVG